ncbi:MAG: hypothetical protein KC912_11995 [Proteobacteria bacterium]|nr:hypothetical protein [Pseudomonadota bacterium]
MRLGLFPYLALILLLVGGQYAAATTLDGSNAIVGALLLLQLLKLPVAAARARDLGFDGDEAVQAMLPIGNLTLFWRLLARTPSDEVRAARQAIHAGESTAYGLVANGLKTLASTAPVVLPAAIGVGLADAALTEWAVAQVPAIAEWEAERLALVGQVLWGVSALLFLYTLMQGTKAATVARSSWFPSLLLPSTLGGGIGFLALGSARGSADPQQMMLIAVIFLGFAMIPFFAVGGAWAAAVAHIATRGAIRGERVGFEAWGQAGSRLRELAAPHAAVRYLISIGLQVMILPGLMYATQYALVDQVAFEQPESRALRASSDLSRGHRARAFRLLLVVGVPIGLLQMAVGVVDMGDVGSLTEVALNPFALSTGAALAGGALYALGFAIFEVAATHMYFERMEVVGAKVVAEVTPAIAEDVFAPPGA